MAELVVRRLLVDMEAPFDRHWCDGSPFRTAMFNALSMSFPVGEQFFIDAVRDAFKALPADGQAAFAAQVQGFVGQEATHRRLHDLFNRHLETQGLENVWAPRALERIATIDRMTDDPRHALAATAAYEHFTAILAHWLLTHADLFGRTEPRLSMLWLWHSAEEAEHRAVAFDLYRALGGSEVWRRRWFRRVTMFFLSDLVRQTVSNLRRDGTLWRWRTLGDAASFLFGTRGLVRQTFGAWRRYFRDGFHPDDLPAPESREWLEANRGAYVPVGR